MMGYTIVIFLFFAMNVFNGSLYAEMLDLNVNAEAAILVNAKTGAILYEKNPHTLHYPASITKIATALYAIKIKREMLDEKITADQESVGWVTEEAKRRSNYAMASYLLVPGSSHIGIKKGEILSFKDLLHGMMLASGDDASNVIAGYVSGSIPKFIEELNAFIKDLGLKDTVFYNPHGLFHPEHQTTAYEMALLTREALKDPLFREIVSTVRYTRPKTNKQEASTLVQTNHLLRPGPQFYSKAIGVKTGHLSLAGNTFVGAAKDGDRILIAVLLKTPKRKDMFLDSVKMFEAAFNQPQVERRLVKMGPQKFSLALPGAQALIKTVTKEEVKIRYYPAEEPQVKSYLKWDKLDFPISKDQHVGDLYLKSSDGMLTQKIALFSQDEVKATWLHWISLGWWSK